MSELAKRFYRLHMLEISRHRMLWEDASMSDPNELSRRRLLTLSAATSAAVLGVSPGKKGRLRHLHPASAALAHPQH